MSNQMLSESPTVYQRSAEVTAPKSSIEDRSDEKDYAQRPHSGFQNKDNGKAGRFLDTALYALCRRLALLHGCFENSFPRRLSEDFSNGE
jgi:hypothetical protein